MMRFGGMASIGERLTGSPTLEVQFTGQRGRRSSHQKWWKRPWSRETLNVERYYL